MSRYAAVIEKCDTTYSAYIPDVPGCVATGATVEDVRTRLVEALASHLELMREAGEPIPRPTTLTDYVEVA